MRRSFLLSTAVLSAALAFGCGDPPRLTAPADPPAPSLGASAQRSTVPSGFAFDDGSRTLFIGFTIEDLIGLCAGTEFTLNEVNQLLVLRPDSSVKFLQQGQDVDVVVFETVGLPCDNLLDVPRFTGTGRLVATDGDLFLSGNRADASMVHFTGTATDESGQWFHLVAIGHQVLAPGSTLPDNVTVLNSTIKIELTPTGG